MDTEDKMSKEKKIRITPEQYELLRHAELRNSDLYKEQLGYMREKEIKTKEVEIANLQREINFKEAQLAANKSIEFHDGYIDKTKPLFHIENDIAVINLKIGDIYDSLKKLKEEQAKDDNPNV